MAADFAAGLAADLALVELGFFPLPAAGAALLKRLVSLEGTSTASFLPAVNLTLGFRSFQVAKLAAVTPWRAANKAKVSP